MTNYSVLDIASIITEDPNSFDTSSMISPSDAEKVARETSSVDPKQNLQKMQRDQEEARKKAELQRKKLLDPQFDEINKSLDQLDADIAANRSLLSNLSNNFTI